MPHKGPPSPNPIPQASRDPESNWEVDIAKSLEEYLLKIGSGEVFAEDFNFAEAALLLQGSVQVYSRKVDSLYSLVLHTLEFLSQKKQDQLENGSAQANQNDTSTSASEADDIFMGLDDVPEESRTSLDSNVSRDDLQRKTVRPPENLLVFEGDCLDTEASELDTYLLATCDCYGDFLLLDPCDAPAVFDFLQGEHCGGLDPTQENPEQSSTQETTPDDNHCSDPVEPGFADDVEMPHPDNIEDPVGEYSDVEDTWKPLNPHEPGNLKDTVLFPMTQMDGVVIPENAKSFEAQQSQQEEHCSSHSPPRFEKLLRPFEFGEENPNVFGDLKDGRGSNTGINFDNDDPDMPNGIDVDPDVPTYPDETIAATPNGTQDDIDTHASLDNLCRSHLNALLAGIAEVEKQSEMDARVSKWKGIIEDALADQDKNPPFDIGSYGEQILDTLSSITDNTGTVSFSEIVSGRPKYEVSRTFSALLQLVNNKSVDLDKGQTTNELLCYTAENPFHVKLIGPNRKRVKSSTPPWHSMSAPRSRCIKRLEIKLTPDGKRRRRSAAYLIQPINLESSG